MAVWWLVMICLLMIFYICSLKLKICWSTPCLHPSWKVHTCNKCDINKICVLRWHWLAVHFKIETLYHYLASHTHQPQCQQCCEKHCDCYITLDCVVRFGLVMSWPSMSLFGSAILHANNPLKNVSSEFVLLCKKATPWHFSLSALIGNFANKVACFSRIVAHPIAISHVKPWSAGVLNTTWVWLFLLFVFEQLRLI